MNVGQSIYTRDNVAHSLVNHHQLPLGNWIILTLTGKELVDEANCIISILSEFLQPKDLTLELWIWMADGNFSVLVLILLRLLKQVWGFSQALGCQTVRKIQFLWHHGAAC